MKSKTAAILIVDDSFDDQMFIIRAFRLINIPNPVQSVNSGNEAIRYLNGEGKYADRKQFPYPTFILSDLKMPDGDGLTLLENPEVQSPNGPRPYPPSLCPALRRRRYQEIVHVGSQFVFRKAQFAGGGSSAWPG